MDSIQRTIKIFESSASKISACARELRIDRKTRGVQTEKSRAGSVFVARGTMKHHGLRWAQHPCARIFLQKGSPSGFRVYAFRLAVRVKLNAKRLLKMRIRALKAWGTSCWKWRCAGGRHYFTRGLVRSVVIGVLLLSAHFRRRRRHDSPTSEDMPPCSRNENSKTSSSARGKRKNGEIKLLLAYFRSANITTCVALPLHTYNTRTLKDAYHTTRRLFSDTRHCARMRAPFRLSRERALGERIKSHASSRRRWRRRRSPPLLPRLGRMRWRRRSLNWMEK